jgi:hypothetical protein
VSKSLANKAMLQRLADGQHKGSDMPKWLLKLVKWAVTHPEVIKEIGDVIGAAKKKPAPKPFVQDLGGYHGGAED